MSIPVIVHVANEDPILCEMDELPSPNSQVLILHNPQRRDGKDIHYLDEGVTTMIVPWHRVNFVQIMGQAEAEEVIGFVRG